MISARAREGFDQLLKDALVAALRATPDEAVEVEAITETAEIKESKMVILTVSSYLFRLMTVLYFTLDKPTRAHFAALNRSDPSALSEQDYLDVIGECGNLCCGTLNRELGKYFPHVGMSTPNILERRCMDYLSALDAEYTRHFRIRLGGGLTLHATLCACDYGDLDFAVEKAAAEDAETGELEMF